MRVTEPKHILAALRSAKRADPRSIREIQRASGVNWPTVCGLLSPSELDESSMPQFRNMLAVASTLGIKIVFIAPPKKPRR